MLLRVSLCFEGRERQLLCGGRPCSLIRFDSGLEIFKIANKIQKKNAKAKGPVQFFCNFDRKEVVNLPNQKCTKFLGSNSIFERELIEKVLFPLSSLRSVQSAISPIIYIAC